jgi:putative membrane protein
MKKNRYNIAVFLMFFFNIIGSCALLSPLLKPIILLFTPVNLLFIFLLFYWSHNDYSLVFIRLLAVVFSLGLAVEIIGVNYKFVFGEYSYGETLGLKLFNTPLVMGINWLNLSLGSFGIISFFTEKKFLLILLSSLLMVSLDYIIEPIAINLDFWSWKNVSVPIHNYFGWFFCAIIAQILIVFSEQKIKPKIAFGVLGSQLVFFLIQYLNYGNIS